MLTEIDDCATQLFVGARLTPDEHCTCTECARVLREGEEITVSAARPADAAVWRLDRLYCRDCAPDVIACPTLGVTEFLMQSRLARTMDVRTQEGFQTLLAVHIIETSPPTEGSDERTQVRTTGPGAGIETRTAIGTDSRADTHQE